MRKLIYSMGVSMDGFIAAPGGNIDWTAPDAELHRFHNERVRELDCHLLGRRLYEVMLYWETADQSPSISDFELEFAPVWKALPKLVFSSTLDEVEGEATLISENVVDVVARLKQEPGRDLAVGGAGLAATLVEHNLIDEYQMFVYPVILGSGTPFFPALEERINLELIETRTFGSRIVYVCYRSPSPGAGTLQ